MPIDPLSDAKILDSWHKNVEPWTHAVRQSAIKSRQLVTDQAIIDAVLDQSPRRVLDVGCGEGWLVRALAQRGLTAMGVDAIAGLVEQARAASNERFEVYSYEQLAAGAVQEEFDLLVANFSLLGKESVAEVFQAAKRLLVPSGKLIVQTLHPLVSCGDLPYIDGWRKGSWDGFSNDFVDPAPWYFRTLNSWFSLFSDHQFQLLSLQEPRAPGAIQPASILFTGMRC